MVGLNVSLFIAKRLIKHQSFVNNARKQGFSLLIVRLGIAAVSVSVTVMLLAVAISKGYQKEVRSKLTGFNAHFQLNNYDLNNSLQALPITRDTLFESIIKKQKHIAHIQPFVTKPGIIKTHTDFEGIVLKGINHQFDPTFITKHLVEGKFFDYQNETSTNEVVISENTARKLNLKLNSDLLIYFIQEPPRVRKLKITGIFNTGLSELDELYAFTGMPMLQRLEGFKTNEITGYEVFTHDFYEMPDALDILKKYTPLEYGIHPINEVFPQLFDWLELLDTNVYVIIALMILVAAINMITALLILIVERSNMIGLLKALGSTNKQIQRIFIYLAAAIIITGLAIGNIVGISIIYIQKVTCFAKLNPADYYLSEVPVHIKIYDIAWINLLAFVLCLIVLLLPVKLVARISPAKSIKFA